MDYVITITERPITERQRPPPITLPTTEEASNTTLGVLTFPISGAGTLASVVSVITMAVALVETIAADIMTRDST